MPYVWCRRGFVMLIFVSNLLSAAKQSRSLWPTKCWPVPFRELSTRLLTQQQPDYVRELSSKVVVVGLAGTYWARHVREGGVQWRFKEHQRAPPFPYTTRLVVLLKLANTNWFKFAGPVCWSVPYFGPLSTPNGKNSPLPLLEGPTKTFVFIVGSDREFNGLRHKLTIILSF